MRKIVMGLIAVVLLTMVGCTTKFSVVPMDGVSPAKLETNKAVYIAQAADGKYSDQVYTGSGMQVSTYVSKVLIPYSSLTEISGQISPKDVLLQEATEIGATYLFVPVITHWEPRAAAWSGIPTRVNIELTVYDVETGQSVAAKSVSVKGKRMTFVSQHAHVLAEQAIQDLVKSFY